MCWHQLMLNSFISCLMSSFFDIQPDVKVLIGHYKVVLWSKFGEKQVHYPELLDDHFAHLASILCLKMAQCCGNIIISFKRLEAM